MSPRGLQAIFESMKRSLHTFFQSAHDVARATVFPLDRVESRRRFILVYAVRLGFLVGRRLWHDNCPRQAGALAYQTMLSLVPLLAVSLSVATWLDVLEYQQQLTELAQTHLMPYAAEAVGRYVINAASGVRMKALGIMGGVGLIALAVMLLLTIERAINEIFRCTEQRPLWRRILTSVVLLSIGPAALGLSIYLTGKVIAFPGVLGVLKPFAVSLPTLFVCYYLIPNTKVQVRFAAIAAVLTALFLEILKFGFAVYVRHLGATLSYLYGTFAILPLAMIWMYLNWLIFLFGAELNAALHEVQRHDRFDIL